MSKKQTIEYIKCKALESNYICHSTIYKNAHEKLDYECDKNHLFKMTFNSFQQGKRCLKCSCKEKLTIEYIKEHAIKNNCICLSNEYISARKIILYKCDKNHKFNMCFNNFQQGQRCPECSKEVSRNKRKNNLEDVIKFINSTGETYISGDYVTNISKLNIRCKRCKFIYTKQYNNFKNGQRCIKCHWDNISGKKHYRFNPIREELKLNYKLRKGHHTGWLINNMKDDPNYKDFLNNNKLYSLDHIIPIKAFCDYITENNLTENEEQINLLKEIANIRTNLRLLKRKENISKGGKYNKEVFINYINEHSSIKNYIYS